MIENKVRGNKRDKNEMHYYYIYMHENKINKKKYIGITYQNPPERRWKNGSSYVKTNKHFNFAIQKYGWDNFNHIILEEGYMSFKEAGDKEDYYINFYNTRNSDFGYNVAPGGYKGLSPNATKAAVKWMEEHPEFGIARAKEMHRWQREHPEEMKRMRQKMQV